MNSNTDASTKILGFKYQEMVALKECLEANDGTKIYLECLGDISDGNISTEVKHSIDDNKKLINTHIDFWKTLFNIIKDYDTFRFYDKFILHTTAEIKKGSIFDGWNNSNKSLKANNIIAISPTNTIQKYYEEVKSFPIENLKDILDKFEIRDNQKTAKIYYKDELVKHPAILNIIKQNDREQFISSLLGYISTELINSDNFIWNIDIDSFRSNFQAYASQYQLEDLKFPVSEVSADLSQKDGYRFVKALEKIKYDKKIGTSMNNYLRASDSQFKMIKSRTSLSENLENYDEDIKEIVVELKESHTDRIIQGSDMNENSRRYFDDSIEKITLKTKIEGVTETRTYYPKGRFLHNLEIESFNLNLTDESE